MAGRNTWVMHINADLGHGARDFYFSTGPVRGIAAITAMIDAPLFQMSIKTRLTNNSSIGDYDTSAARLSDRTFRLRNAGIRNIPRNTRATLYIGRTHEPFSDYRQFGVVIVDRVESVGSRYLDIVALDPTAELQQTLHDQVYTDDVPRDDLKGQVVPILLGKAYQFAPVAIDPEPGDNVYDLNDQPFSAIHSIEDKGDPFEPADYSKTATGFNLVAPPAGTVTCTASGDIDEDNLAVGADLLAGLGSFQSWAGIPPNDKPFGWTVEESPPNAVVTQQIPGTLTMSHNSGFIFPQISRHVGMQEGKQYQVSFTVYEVSGSCFLSNLNGHPYLQISSIGPQTHTITATDSGISVLLAGGTVRIDHLQVRELSATKPLLTIGQLVRGILKRRGITQYSQADLDALDASIGDHEAGLWMENPTTASAAMAQLLDSVGAWVYADRNGVLRFGLHQEPQNVASFIIDDNIINDDVNPEPDYANGLSTILKSRRNWQPIDGNSAAGSLTTGEKESLAKPYRITNNASTEPDAYYRHAVNNCPVETLLVDDESGQRTIDRWNQIYAVPREFLEVPVNLSIDELLERNLYETVQLKSERLKLTQGKNYRLWAIQVVSKRRAVLTLWG